MLVGIKLHANPTPEQKKVLSQWMGCARLIWNAKVDEELYHRTFANKYYPIGTYAPIDKKAAHFKSKELTPWLYDCPSQIIRNSATNWCNTYFNFMKGLCGRPKRKPKSDRGSIHLTRELFRFEHCSDGNIRLFIGSKTNNIGYLSFKKHANFNTPKSIYIRKERGRYSISFCYEDGFDAVGLKTNQQHLDYLRDESDEYLEQNTIGIDRGVAIPVQAGEKSFDFSEGQKKNLSESERYIKRLQRRLSRQTKGSNHRNETKSKLSKSHAKKANIRNDFAHQTSRAIVDGKETVIVLEDLKTSNMTRRPAPKQNEAGQYLPNHASQKAGLNQAILNVGWHQIEVCISYKAHKEGKAVFKVAPHSTSQECAQCGYTHPDNRKTQSKFQCGQCEHADNADQNASMVIKKRAIRLIKDTGTVLSEKGVLMPLSDTGRGGKRQTNKAKSNVSRIQRSVKKEKIAA
ncbi:RNA-guided endonuclease InsQ/TnpB family protein [Orrella sp. 11846]|uniref:RNA-guided endonuclease InsQ/TnpB family protein n=1 Tax=Orrella sp. 11846 TaxID=3409913 RepID=UPI003B5A9399